MKPHPTTLQVAAVGHVKLSPIRDYGDFAVRDLLLFDKRSEVPFFTLTIYTEHDGDDSYVDALLNIEREDRVEEVGS